MCRAVIHQHNRINRVRPSLFRSRGAVRLVSSERCSATANLNIQWRKPVRDSTTRVQREGGHSQDAVFSIICKF